MKDSIVIIVLCISPDRTSSIQKKSLQKERTANVLPGGSQAPAKRNLSKVPLREPLNCKEQRRFFQALAKRTLDL